MLETFIGQISQYGPVGLAFAGMALGIVRLYLDNRDLQKDKTVLQERLIALQETRLEDSKAMWEIASNNVQSNAAVSRIITDQQRLIEASLSRRRS